MARLTLKIVKDRLNDINPNIEILSDEYTNNQTKLSCKCLKCDHIWDVSWNSLQQCRGCPRCNKDKQGLTLKKIKLMLQYISPDIRILSNKYVNNYTKLKCKCVLDGHEWGVKWNSLQQGSGCPKCSGNVKPSIIEVIGELKEINPNIEVLSNAYINNRTKLACKCVLDAHEWGATWKDLQQGTGCPKCAGCIKLTIEDVVCKLKYINPKIKVLSKKYGGGKGILRCKCLIDGCEWDAMWNNLQQGVGCPKCSSYREKLTIEDVINGMFEINPNIKILDKGYINSTTNLNCKCIIDGYEWGATWNNISMGSGCPKCAISNSVSKGEKVISDILSILNIEYSMEKRFDDCRNINMLPFDFSVEDKVDTLFLIEYDGKQHFDPVEFFGGEEKFKKRIHNDNIKTNYCKDNNIPLLRIPYWDFNNIEEILVEWLVKYGLIKDV